MEKSKKTTTKSDPSTGDQLGKRKCLSTFFSTEFRADRWVNGGSNKEPLARRGDEAFGDLNRVIVGEIEENDDKVRSVYGGSVEQAPCRNLTRSCAPKPRRRSRSEARPGADNCPARPGPARPEPAEGDRRERRTRRR